MHVKSLMRLGLRPVLLGLCSTLVILAVVLVGVTGVEIVFLASGRSFTVEPRAEDE